MLKLYQLLFIAIFVCLVSVSVVIADDGLTKPKGDTPFKLQEVNPIKKNAVAQNTLVIAAGQGCASVCQSACKGKSNYSSCYQVCMRNCR